MDNRYRHQGFTGPLYSFISFGNQSTVGSKFTPLTNTSLTLGLSSAPHPYICSTKSNKRKWGAVDGNESSEDDFSLVLGLGRSSSSSDSSKTSYNTAFSDSSAKETDEETSMDVELNFQLHLGSDSDPVSKKHNVGGEATSKVSPFFDLQLSLSGTSTSVITSMCPSSTYSNKSLRTSLSGNCSVPMDDGSTSSCWKSGDSVFRCISSAERVDNVTPRDAITTIADQVLAQQTTFTSLLPPKNSSSPPGTTLTQNRRGSSTKTCQVSGCQTGARGASGLCIAHGGGRRCKRDGCQRGAEGRTTFCKAHGGGRRCEFLGCTKSAEGPTDYCIGHGGGIRCGHEGCSHASRGKTGYCIRHGGGKRCQKKDCNKSAEDHTGICISHGGGRRCQYPLCKNGAQGSTTLCKRHGGGKKCTFPEYQKGAEGCSPLCKSHGGGKRFMFGGGCIGSKSLFGGTEFCVNHGVGKRCDALECTGFDSGQTSFCVNYGGVNDFHEGHGVLKKCSWGKEASGVSIEALPCHRYSLSGNEFCILHSALVQDLQVHGGATLGSSVTPATSLHAPARLRETAAAEMVQGFTNLEKSYIGWNSFNRKEGRVHGGSLMSFLSHNATSEHAPSGSEPSGHTAASVMPHKWV